MTLDSKLSKAVYEGNGSTTVFPFAFKVWETSHIAVTMTDAAGVSTNVTSNCTVTLTSSGGSVTYPNSGSPLPSGAKLAITRNMPFTQGINLTTASRFDPQVLEDGLDQATAERQQILEQMARAVILPATSSESPQDVVAAIYASRDSAAASASEASAQSTAAQSSAHEAKISAGDAASSATAAALSAAEAEAASGGLAPRMDAVETKNTQQDNRLTAVELKNTQQDTAISGKADSSALAGKLNADFSNKPSNIRYVVDAWASGANFYRKWSDGWIEQGGQVNNPGEALSTISLNTPMASTLYNARVQWCTTSTGADSGYIGYVKKDSKTISSFQFTGQVNPTRPVVEWEVKGF